MDGCPLTSLTSLSRWLVSPSPLVPFLFSLSVWLQLRQKRLLILAGVVVAVCMWATVISRLSCAPPEVTPHPSATTLAAGPLAAAGAAAGVSGVGTDESLAKRRAKLNPLAGSSPARPTAVAQVVGAPSARWCTDPYPAPLEWATSTPAEAANPFDHCRRGSQRCIPWSTATPYSRFSLLEDSVWAPNSPAEAIDPTTRTHLQRMHGLLSAASDDADSVSNAPYDLDGTPALRTRLREYLASHRAATDFPAALAKIERQVAQQPDAKTVDARETRARKFALWQRWIGAQKYMLHVDNESGFGNKMLPIVSAFAYALVTRRHLLLFFPVPGFKDLFTVGPSLPGVSPLVTDWLVFLEGLLEVTRKLDPTFPLAQDGTTPDLTHADASEHWTTRMHQRMADTSAGGRPQIKNFQEILALMPNSLSGNDAAGAPSVPLYTTAALDLQAPDSSQAQADMLCKDWAHDPALTGAWVIRTWSDQYWLPLLSGNEFVRPTLLAWVNENNMYGPLARFFLNWSPVHVRERAADFASVHFGAYNIGLQLRRKERVGLRRSEVAGALEGAKSLAVLYLGSDPMEVNLTPEDQLALRARRRTVTFFIATDDFASREKWAAELCAYGHVAFSPTVEYPRDEGTPRGVID